ncbi:MAG: AlkA N-terminal domain-containing protein, partial [Vicinamibacterales bacterium]
VTRALRLIEGGAFEHGSIDDLAERLGIGARQLSRLFAMHVGASPGAVGRARRIHLAKQLIHDTSLPLSEVAHAAGFGSVRRFNETFKDLFGRVPSDWRRTRRNGPQSDLTQGLTIRLPYSPPYGWDDMRAFLAHRAVSGIEQVAGDTYARSVSIEGEQGVIAVGPGRRHELLLRIHWARTASLAAIVARVRGMFDCSADPGVIDRHLAADPWLAPLVAARPGLRVAGAWTGFELAVRAVVGQQVTVQGGRRLSERLVAALGTPLDAKLGSLYPGVTHLFPTPATISISPLDGLGMTGARAKTLHSLAQALLADSSVLAQRRDLEDSIRTLTAIPGVGDWTAHYIAMRELREPDAFPAGDAALLRAAGAIAGRRVSVAELRERAERWRPWRAYGAAHLWASLGDTQQTSAREYTNVA